MKNKLDITQITLWAAIDRRIQDDMINLYLSMG